MNDRPTHSQAHERPRVLVVGGGVAGVEALLALGDLAGERIELTLVAPEPAFLYKPLLVEEPFALDPAERHELAPLAEECGGNLVRGSLAAVRTDESLIELEDGTKLPYDRLVVCVGGRMRPAFEDAVTFPSPDPLNIDDLIERGAASPSRRIAFVVPPGVTWPLPVYELALMTERRARESGRKVEVAVVTPEESPLIVFGTTSSDAVSTLLTARGITIHSASRVRGVDGGGLAISPGEVRLDVGAVVSLAAMEGPGIRGLPADEHGFIPIDDHARVKGTEGIYAAGDGTNFPVKQGGLGTQQADAAAEEIAASAGAELDPQPFEPVLRGMLLTGDESLSMKQKAGGGAGEGAASSDWLWWPPHKIGGRYLAAWLGHEAPGDLEPHQRQIDVEVMLPREWHEEPMALDPFRARPVD